MLHKNLKTILNKKRCTLLNVGVVSTNCVDATIELANEYEVPIMLIASRRQVDSEEFGCGYVNNWSTGEFSKYVKARDKKNKIILARDHGGPWQNNKEVESKLGLEQAMKSAKSSYSSDIAAEFQIIHIDCSIDIHGQPSTNEVLERIFDLYEYCYQQAKAMNKEIIFEIGTEEQSGNTNTTEELVYTLNAVENFCKLKSFPKPSFVVIQSGTRVVETRNVGLFEELVQNNKKPIADLQLAKMIKICDEHGIFMKQHNTDYLTEEALRFHSKIGIHAANVAPEFGVIETRALLFLLENNGLQKLADRFLQLAFESKRWNKWMLENTKATDRDRAIIAGHYIFSKPECIEIKKSAAQELKRKNIELEAYLKQQIKIDILRYLINFNLISS